MYRWNNSAICRTYVVLTCVACERSMDCILPQDGAVNVVCGDGGDGPDHVRGVDILEVHWAAASVASVASASVEMLLDLCGEVLADVGEDGVAAGVRCCAALSIAARCLLHELLQHMYRALVPRYPTDTPPAPNNDVQLLQHSAPLFGCQIVYYYNPAGTSPGLVLYA